MSEVFQRVWKSCQALGQNDWEELGIETVTHDINTVSGGNIQIRDVQTIMDRERVTRGLVATQPVVSYYG